MPLSLTLIPVRWILATHLWKAVRASTWVLVNSFIAALSIEPAAIMSIVRRAIEPVKMTVGGVHAWATRSGQVIDVLSIVYAKTKRKDIGLVP